MCYDAEMKRDEVKDVVDRVLSWPTEDQEKLVRFVNEIEQRHSGDDRTDEEWDLIEMRAKRRELASDEEVVRVFGRYRRA